MCYADRTRFEQLFTALGGFEDIEIRDRLKVIYKGRAKDLYIEMDLKDHLAELEVIYLGSYTDTDQKTYIVITVITGGGETDDKASR